MERNYLQEIKDFIKNSKDNDSKTEEQNYRINSYKLTKGKKNIDSVKTFENLIKKLNPSVYEPFEVEDMVLNKNKCNEQLLRWILFHLCETVGYPGEYPKEYPGESVGYPGEYIKEYPPVKVPKKKRPPVKVPKKKRSPVKVPKKILKKKDLHGNFKM